MVAFVRLQDGCLLGYLAYRSFFLLIIISADSSLLMIEKKLPAACYLTQFTWVTLTCGLTSPATHTHTQHHTQTLHVIEALSHITGSSKRTLCLDVWNMFLSCIGCVLCDGSEPHNPSMDILGDEQVKLVLNCLFFVNL